jgi:hypothetical protein
MDGCHSSLDRGPPPRMDRSSGRAAPHRPHPSHRALVRASRSAAATRAVRSQRRRAGADLVDVDANALAHGSPASRRQASNKSWPGGGGAGGAVRPGRAAALRGAACPASPPAPAARRLRPAAARRNPGEREHPLPVPPEQLGASAARAASAHGLGRFTRSAGRGRGRRGGRATPPTARAGLRWCERRVRADL